MSGLFFLYVIGSLTLGVAAAMAMASYNDQDFELGLESGAIVIAVTVLWPVLLLIGTFLGLAWVGFKVVDWLIARVKPPAK